MAVGLLIERWLFFAEAEHVSMLYYGADAARERSVESGVALTPPSPRREMRCDRTHARLPHAAAPAMSGCSISASISAVSARRGPGRLK